ncbi:MAG: class I SAM-dependent methyltransferase [Gammaproteobacteria bacterium]
MVSPSEKWDRIYAQQTTEQPETASVLREHTFLLPPRGTALDLACGLGANAMLLAHAGLNTEAWDISPVALQRLQQRADTEGMALRTRCLDIQPAYFVSESFDAIVVSRFLDRSLCPAIVEALKPGGLLFYQTYTREKIAAQGPTNPAYLLGENELLRLFSALRIVFYCEHGMIGEFAQGLRNEAQLIGQKRPTLEIAYD